MEGGKVKAAIRAHVPRELRNWLRSPAKAADWLWLSTRAQMGWTQQFRISDDKSIICHPIAYRAALKAQTEDPEQAAELQRFLEDCRPGMVLFDVGANFGLFSLICVRMGGRAIAIEPSAIGSRIIRKQMELNRVDSTMKLIEAAAGEHEGVLEMLSAGVFSDGYYKYERARDSRELTRVPMTTLDRLCARFGGPSHVKIDVEGYEAAVIRGAKELLAQRTATVFLELHNEMARSAGEDTKFCVEELSRNGYSIYSVHGRKLTLEEATQPAICRIVATQAA